MSVLLANGSVIYALRMTQFSSRTVQRDATRAQYTKQGNGLKINAGNTKLMESSGMPKANLAVDS